VVTGGTADPSRPSLAGRGETKGPVGLGADDATMALQRGQPAVTRTAQAPAQGHGEGPRLPGSGRKTVTENAVPPYGPPSDPERTLARKRVEARRGLSAHAVTYVVVNLFLIAVWAMTGADYFWPAWVLAGWGVGLALNAWDVLLRRPITEEDIEREIRRSRGG
jgi:hypothetical protein